MGNNFSILSKATKPRCYRAGNLINYHRFPFDSVGIIMTRFEAINPL